MERADLINLQLTQTQLDALRRLLSDAMTDDLENPGLLCLRDRSIVNSLDQVHRKAKKVDAQRPRTTPSSRVPVSLSRSEITALIAVCTQQEADDPDPFLWPVAKLRALERAHHRLNTAREELETTQEEPDK